MALLGPHHILRPDQLGKELAGLILAHSQAAELAMFTAANRAVGEVVKAIDATPSVMRRKKGPSAGQPMPAPVDQGGLRNSVRASKVIDGAIVEVTAPHGAHMEYGTRPHTPPKPPIEAWAKRKVRGLKPKKKPKKKSKKKKNPSTVPKKKKVLGAIAQLLQKGRRKESAKAAAQKRAEDLAAFREDAADDLAERAWIAIRLRGTEGREFFARASQKFAQIVKEEVEKRLAKIK